MSKISSVKETKCEANRGVTGSMAAGAKEAELFAEFSDLLDKIASKVNTSSAGTIKDLASMVEVETIKVAVKPDPIQHLSASFAAEPNTAGIKDDVDGREEAEENEQAPTLTQHEDEQEKAEVERHEGSTEAPKAKADSLAQQAGSHDTQPPEAAIPSIDVAVGTAAAAQAQASDDVPAAGAEEAADVVPEETYSVLEDATSSAPESKAVGHEKARGKAEVGTPSEKPEEQPDPSSVEPTETVGEEDILTQVLMQQLQARLNDQGNKAEESSAKPQSSAATQVAAAPVQGFQPMVASSTTVAPTLKAPLEESVRKVGEVKQAVTNFQQLQSDMGMLKKEERVTAHMEESRSRPLGSRVTTHLLERVEQALKEVAKAKDGKTISVRLNPDELGTVKVDVTLRDGSLHARLIAESPQVIQLLRERSGDLQGSLRKLGLNVDSVTVTVVADERKQEQTFFNSPNGQGNGYHQGNKGEVSGSNEGSGLVASLPASMGHAAVVDHWIA